jgi:hypothetical protein
MPVNAQEKVQVGHYYLLRRDYAQAWRWYQEAERELPLPAPVAVRDLMGYWHALQGPRDFSFFQYHCLTRLGRTKEAQAKLDHFRRHFLPRFARAAGGEAAPNTVMVDGKTLEQHLQELLDPGNLVAPLLQDLYAAEVFLSLDAAQDAEAFFRTTLGQADTDAARLSRAIVLGQILLLEKKHGEYAELATQTIGPLLTRVLKPRPDGGQSNFLDLNSLSEFLGGLALLPLGVPEFLARLPDKQLQEMRPRWEKLHANANDASRPLLDLVLRGLYQALGREKERDAAAGRLKRWPGSTLLPVEGELGKAIIALHAQMRNLVGRR